MKTQDEKKEVVPSFDDLVFENRNKEYGAFTMRKKYNTALIWSMLVSVFFISATVITPFIVYNAPPIEIKPPVDSLKIEFDNTILNIQIKNPEPPKPEISTKSITYVAPVVVEKLSEKDSANILTNDEINLLVKNNDVNDIKVVPTKIEIDPSANDKINEPFKVTEKPYFGIEGDKEFKSWITQHIIYPAAALDANIQGKVYLQFVIEKDGSISSIQVIKSIDPELSKEAVRVLEQSPKWNPGKIDGTPVRVKVYFPITFSLI